MSIQTVRYGSYDVLVEQTGVSFTARVRKTTTREIVGEAVVGHDFDSAVAKAKKIADTHRYEAMLTPEQPA